MNFYKIFTSAICLLGISLSAQTRIDSLKEKIAHAAADTEKVHLLNELSRNIRSQNLDEAYAYGTEARELAVKIGFTRGKLSAQLNQGLALYFKGDWNSALEIYIASLEEAERINYKRFIPQVLIDIGIIYEVQGHYGDAISTYNKALKLFEQLGDKKGLGSIYSNLGSAYYHTMNYRRSLEYYEKSRTIIEEFGNERALSGLLNNIAGVYSDMKDYRKSLDYYFRSLELKRKLNEKSGIALTMGNIGDVYREMRDFANAIKYDTLSANLCKQVGNKNLLKDSYLSLAQCYQQMSDYKSAYHYHELYSAIKDSLYTLESAQSIAEMETKFQSVEKDKELLLKDSKIKEQQSHSRQQQIVMISLLAGLGLALLAIFFIFKGYRDKQKANKLIEKQKELVEKKQKEILDSIHYARRIQNALLASEKYIERNLNRLMR
jgi:tetratricopeptide (TPR) repeat protein